MLVCDIMLANRRRHETLNTKRHRVNHSDNDIHEHTKPKLNAYQQSHETRWAWAHDNNTRRNMQIYGATQQATYNVPRRRSGTCRSPQWVEYEALANGLEY